MTSTSDRSAGIPPSRPLTEAELRLLERVQANLVPPDALGRALSLRERLPHLGRALLESGALTEQQILDALDDSGLAWVCCDDCGTDWLDPPTATCADCGAAVAGRPPPLPLEKLGGYLLERELGRGAMGVVYRARDESLGRPVALKLLLRPPEGSTWPARFEREARLTAGLSHPNVVRIHRVGVEQELRYLVMEYIDGRTLAEELPRLSRAQRIELLAQVARGAGHAHARGIVHRDLKPANVLLAGGRAVVVDFGLARDCAARSRLTESGAVVGTLRYMAPEQLLGRQDQIGPPADVWALGVMLYEMLADRSPFPADSAAALCQAVLDGEPAALGRRAAPPELAAICFKALERQAGRRYPDAGSLAADLERWQRGEPTAARPRSALRRIGGRLAARPFVACGVLLLVLLASLVAWRLRRPPPAVPAEGRPPAATRERPPGPAAPPRLQRLRRLIQEVRAGSYLRSVRIRDRLDELERELAALEPVEGAEELAALGMGWYLAGDRRRAERCLLRAAAIRPADGWVNDYLGRIYLERAMASLLQDPRESLHRLDRLKSSRQAQRALAYLRRPRTGWVGAGPLEQHVARAYLALARLEPERVERLCRQGLRRFGDRPGTEEYWILLGWVRPQRESLAAWSKALQRRPHDPWAYYLRGTKRWAGGDRAGARADIAAALRISPRFALARLTRATMRQTDSDTAGALADFNRALALDPELSPGYNNRGLLKRTLGDLPGALADFDRALALEPHRASVLTNRGALRRRLGQRTAALADLDRALQLSQQIPHAYHNRGMVLLELDQPARALADFDRALALDPKMAVAWYGRGHARMAAGDPRGALSDYDRAIALGPERPAFYNGRGLARMRSGKPAGARTDLDRALQLDPRHATAYYNRANLRRRTDLAGAIADYTLAIRHQANHAMAYNNRGTARKAHGDRKGALADYQAALRIDPRLAQAYINRGNLGQDRGDHAAALADYQSATRCRPDWWRGWASAGWTLDRLGRRAEALRALQRARELAPTHWQSSIDGWIRALGDDR